MSLNARDVKKRKTKRGMYWKRMVDDFIKSGLSRIEFAKRNDLKLSSLSYHIRHKSKPKAMANHFIPVILNESEPQGRDFKVFTQSGLEIRIPSDFSEVGLTRLMKTLRGVEC
jgi:hypothetical protein